MWSSRRSNKIRTQPAMTSTASRGTPGTHWLAITLARLHPGRDREGKLRFILPFFEARRIIQDVADLNHIHLPPQAFVRCIDRDQPALEPEPCMRVDPLDLIAASALLPRR